MAVFVEALAQKIWKNKRYQHLFFALATVISIGFAGYYFGTFDQGSHIPFLKKYIDPTLYPNDAFFNLRLTHYSYFWFFFKPFLKIGLLEESMFAVYILAIYATFWALFRLSKTLFNNPLTSFITVACFIFPHVSFGGFTPIEFSLLNRTFALPFLLWSIDLFLKKRYLISFFLLGLMYNIHVISVNFVLCMLLFDIALRFRTIGFSKIAGGLVLFLLGASPVLYWKLGSSPVDFGVHEEWYRIISQSILPQVFYLFSLNPSILFATLGGFGTLLLFYIAYKQRKHSSYDISVRNFIWAILIITAVGAVTGLWFPVTIIIQSQIIRVGIFLLLLGYLYYIDFVVRQYESGRLKKPDFLLTATAVIFSITALVPLAVHATYQSISSISLRRRLTFFLVPAAFFGILMGLYTLQIWRPGIYIYSQRTPWYDVQVWARDNTPKNTLFITPPHKWWLYDSDWRVISERSTVVTFNELLETAFEPNDLKRWKPRFEEVAPGAIEQFHGDAFSSFKITEKAFYRLSTEDFRRIAEKYNAVYLVVEKPHRYSFTVVYENEGFLVYRISFR